MKTIAICNLKGGVGKTTTALNLGAVLAANARVLLIDADSQYNLSLHLRADCTGATLASLFEGESYYDNLIQPTYLRQVDIIPASLDLMAYDLSMLTGGKANRYALRDLCTALAEDEAYDYVLIDCPPSFSAACAAALAAADEVILPTTVGAYEQEGAQNLLRQIGGMRQINPGLHVAGVLITRYYRSALTDQGAEHMKGGLGTALTGLTQGIGSAGGGLLKMGSAAGGAIKALMGLLAANPVILIVVGAIAALVAIGIAIYKNWDTIKAGALALWETVKEKFQGIKDAITNAFNSVLEWAGKLKDFFVDTFLGAVNKVKETFDKVKDAVGGLINKVKDFLGMDTNKEVKVTTKYDDSHGHNALGTSYWRGGPTAVHERGGEIIDLPNGTRIIPHDVSEKMAGGRNVNVYVTVQGNVIGNRQYADELGEIVVGKVLRAMDNV